MTIAASSGDIEFTLTTYDAQTNVTIIANATGISSGNEEIPIAKRIYDQLSIIIDQYDATYSKIPSLIQNGPQATFQLTRTDHCICFYSETQFSLEISNNDTGTIFVIDTVPVLSTVDDAISYGGLIGQDYSSYTNTQISQLLLISSAELIAYMKNPIVASTYRFQYWGDWSESVQLDMRPLISVDPPYIIRPDILTFLTQTSIPEPTLIYDIEFKTGWIAYKYSQNVFNSYEPFDDNNDWRLTYIAGEKAIPALVKKALALLAGFITDGSFDGVDSLQGGTFKVGFSSGKDRLTLILLPLKAYFL